MNTTRRPLLLVAILVVAILASLGAIWMASLVTPSSKQGGVGGLGFSLLHAASLLDSSWPSPKNKRPPRGWIVDVPFWASQYNEATGKYYPTINETELENYFGPNATSATSLYQGFHLLLEDRPNFTDIYEALRGPRTPSRNDAPSEQHVVGIVYAAALYHHLGFRIVNKVSMLQNEISPHDYVFLYWNNIGPWGLRKYKFEQMSGTKLKKDIAKAMVHWLRRQRSWIPLESQGKNLIAVNSFPEKWQFRPWTDWPLTQVFVSEILMLPRPRRLDLHGRTRHIIPYNLRRMKEDHYPTIEPTAAAENENSNSHATTTTTTTRILRDKEESIFALMNAGCKVNGPDGKRLRYWIVEDSKSFLNLTRPLKRALPEPYNHNMQDSSISLSCDSSAHGIHKGGHNAYIERMDNAVYCLVPPGDTMSSLRSAEVIAHSCIPVFVGPPFHSIFLPSIFDWASMSIFIYVKNNERWYTKPKKDQKESETALLGVNEEVLRVMGEDLSKLHVVEDLNDIYEVLTDLYFSKYTTLRAGLETARRKLALPSDPFDSQSLRNEVDYFPTPPFIAELFEQILPGMSRINHVEY